MRCRVCSQPARTQDITIPMKVLGASRAAAHLPNCAHTLRHVAPSLCLPLLSFFMSLSRWLPLLFPLIPSLSPSRRLSPGQSVGQTFPVPDSLLWSGAPSHADCYLSVWAMFGDKTLARILSLQTSIVRVLAKMGLGDGVAQGPKTETTG